MKCTNCGRDVQRPYFFPLYTPCVSVMPDPNEAILPLNIDVYVGWACPSCRRMHYRDGTPVPPKGKANRALKDGEK